MFARSNANTAIGAGAGGGWGEVAGIMVRESVTSPGKVRREVVELEDVRSRGRDEACPTFLHETTHFHFMASDGNGIVPNGVEAKAGQGRA
ncbi:hypothetical protein AXG93_2145s1750 [Marchantia polymorpha subsp. ruderalis]|uniref:Uncharacterized protein n=1 Tax=Marchantia polymorpha subsp. ruderalis TaxID=1480154 RepID=A0A176W106_MARPO|nr:hypothetical protein AXG93_2145s1750 [Marchantia polymorpha subsp. ruderalis]